MTAVIDPRVPFVHVREAVPPCYTCWKIEDYEAGEQDPTGTFQGDQDVMWAALEKDGNPVLNLRVRYGFPSYDKPDDTDTRQTDAKGHVNFNIGRNGWDKKLNRGVYWIHPETAPADVVEFMGMDPDHHHRDFVLYYSWNDGSTPPPPPPPPDEPGIWDELKAFAATLPDVGAEYIAKDGRTFTVLKDSRVGGVVVGTEGELYAFWREEL